VRGAGRGRAAVGTKVTAQSQSCRYLEMDMGMEMVMGMDTDTDMDMGKDIRGMERMAVERVGVARVSAHYWEERGPGCTRPGCPEFQMDRRAERVGAGRVEGVRWTARR